MEVSASPGTSIEAIRRCEMEVKNKVSANLIDNVDIDGGHESDSTISSVISIEDNSVADVSGQNLKLSLLDDADDSISLNQNYVVADVASTST
ncbi:hypothetical protein EUTSA_v10000396mg [Eutrema salsugineum]|uniref:Uncharacterized protein n=1 Tax=Eutrema salsugineum TaxID=72664 RepID=V4LVB5_EUTSA|nr:hypothetical protein EUTSA_v10000396mg [Eutrema salsugineum]